QRGNIHKPFRLLVTVENIQVYPHALLLLF
ncbi:MAG: hypothetical protein ACI840_002078, partial [Ulvibacter sp.]